VNRCRTVYGPPGGSAEPQSSGVLGIPESSRHRGRVNSTVRLNRALGTARRKRSGVIRVPPGEFEKVESLAQEDGGQGVLPNRNRQGWWAYLSPPGAAAGNQRSEARHEPRIREENESRSNSATAWSPRNAGSLAQEDGGQGVLLDRNQQGLWAYLSPPGAVHRESGSQARE